MHGKNQIAAESYLTLRHTWGKCNKNG